MFYQANKLREFADEIDFKLELDPEVVKESLRVGQKDVEKGDGSYKIRPTVINDNPLYSPLDPYENCKYCCANKLCCTNFAAFVFNSRKLHSVRSL